MQAALYFPFINVPPTAWWTRALLYWDRVGTIVPRAYREDPDQLGEYTLELIRAELVHQFLPEWAGGALRRNFDVFLHRLDDEEVDRRRRRLRRAPVAYIHRDKWLSYQSGLQEIRRMGLARDGDGGRGQDWVAVEQTTANEFMAALALTLCQEADRDSAYFRDDPRPSATWVPTTDRPEASDVLLTGLEPSTPGRGDRRVRLRVRGEIAAAEIRTELLEDLLPVPAGPLSTSQILAFRGKHGSLLPNLRRYLESKIDEALAIDDEILRFRMLDRLRDELEDQIVEAETYLKELPLRAVTRSSLLKILKFVPGLKDPIEAGEDLAQNARTNPDFESEPLAYLAFARVTFARARCFQTSRAGGMPLVEAIAGTG